MKLNFKLERGILTLLLDNERTYFMQKEEVREYILKMKSFLKSGDVSFAYSGADLTFEEEMELCDIVDEVFGYRVKFCYKKKPPETLLRHIITNEERFVRKLERTVRAGELIESNGDLIIIGDVNPTAHLVAAGDIYVIGNLRGVAHAGCSGDKKAIVYAMQMNPVMIKIADKIGFNPEMSKSNQCGKARLENDEIRINMM